MEEALQSAMIMRRLRQNLGDPRGRMVPMLFRATAGSSTAGFLMEDEVRVWWPNEVEQSLTLPAYGKRGLTRLELLRCLDQDWNPLDRIGIPFLRELVLVDCAIGTMEDLMPWGDL